MGYEIERFVNRPVDAEYLCSICFGVFEQPVHGPCGHTFCSKCIDNWIPQSTNINSCPLDKRPLHKKDLVAVSIPFRNLLGRLDIKCDFEASGCTNVCPMHDLPEHVRACPFNPDGEMTCDQGCELTFLRRDRDSHKCIGALKEVIAKQRCEIADLNKRINAKRSYETAFQHRVQLDRNISDLMSVHADMDMLTTSRRNAMMRSARNRLLYDPSSGSGPMSRARTPPPLPGSLSSRISQGPASSSSSGSSIPTSTQLHSRTRLPLPESLPDVQVHVQRLTDEDLDLYGVTRAARILNSRSEMARDISRELASGRSDRPASPSDLSISPSQQLPSSSSSSSSSSFSASSSSSSTTSSDSRFNLLTQMLSRGSGVGCSSTRSD